MTNKNAELPRDYDPLSARCYFPVNNMQADREFPGYFGHLDPLLGWETTAEPNTGIKMSFTRSVTERVRPTALLFVHEMYARVPNTHPVPGQGDVKVWAIDRPITKYDAGDVKRTAWKREITPGLQSGNMGGIVLPKYPRGLDQNSPEDMWQFTATGTTHDEQPVFRMDASDWFVWLMAHNFYMKLSNVSSDKATSGRSGGPDAGIRDAAPKFNNLTSESFGFGEGVADRRKSMVSRHSYYTKGEKFVTSEYQNSIMPGLSSKYGDPTELTSDRKAMMFLDMEKRLAVQSKYLPSVWVREYQKVEYPDDARHTHLLMLRELRKNT